MGTIEYLKEHEYISGETAEAINKISGYIDTAGELFGYYKAAKSLLSFFGFLGEEKNPVMEKLDEISEKIDKLFDYITNATYTSTNFSKQLELQNFRGSLKKAYIQFQHHMKEPDNVLYSTDTFFDVPLEIAQTLFENDSNIYWRKVYDRSKDDFNTMWTGRLGNNDIGSDGLAWEWRLPIVNYLEAISIRVIMVMNLVPDFDKDELYKEEFYTYSVNLLNIYLKIVNRGIKVIRPPKRWEYISAACGRHKDPRAYTFDYGALDTYSMLRNIKKNYAVPNIISINGKLDDRLPDNAPHYYESMADMIVRDDHKGPYYIYPHNTGDNCLQEFMDETWGYITGKTTEEKQKEKEAREKRMKTYGVYLNCSYINLRRRHMVETLKAFKELHEKMGMPALWKTMNNLRVLSGRLPLDESTVPNCLEDFYKFDDLDDSKPKFSSSTPFYWSLRNTISAVDRNYLKGFGKSSNNTLSISELKKLLGVHSNYSLIDTINGSTGLEELVNNKTLLEELKKAASGISAANVLIKQIDT